MVISILCGSPHCRLSRPGYITILLVANFQSAGEKLIAKLRDIVRAEVEKDSNLLYKDRSKSSILIGGAVDRFAYSDEFG